MEQYSSVASLPRHEMGDCEPSTWLPIATAPRDGTLIIGLQWGRYSYERNIEIVWWQPEFDAWISGARMIEMAPGYTIDGQTSKLHSPQILRADWWQPFAAPVRGSQHLSSDGEVQGAQATVTTELNTSILSRSTSGGKPE